MIDIQAVPVPDPRWMSFHITRPNADITMFENEAHISQEICDAIAHQSENLLARKVWSLRAAG